MMRETMIEETVPGGSVVECLVVAPGRSNKSSRMHVHGHYCLQEFADRKLEIALDISIIPW
jgi:hypothetical protein